MIEHFKYNIASNLYPHFFTKKNASKKAFLRER